MTRETQIRNESAASDASAHDAAGPRGLRRALALFALALGGFGIGSAEFVTMGLLPDIANSLLPDLMATDAEQGIARAGMAITAYALGVVIGAPVLSLLAVRMSRTRMIVLLAAVLMVGALLSANMPTFELTVAARFLAGLPHGAYLGVASLLAASLMGPGSQGKGVALALSGLTVANLIGVPILTAVGQAAGWRVAYLLIAAIFLATTVLLRATIPAQAAPQGRRITDELRAFRRVQLWVVVVIAAVGFSGSFAVFSYIADIGQQVAGASASYIPWLLVAAGAGMTIGNIIGGMGTDRSLRGTLVLAFPVYIAAMITMMLTAHHLIGLTITFFLVNMAHSVLSPPFQTWLMRISGRSEVLGAAVHHAAFNVANALGAYLGGMVIAAGLGLASPTYVGIVMSSAGFVLLLGAFWLIGVRSRQRLAQLQQARIELADAPEDDTQGHAAPQEQAAARTVAGS